MVGSPASVPENIRSCLQCGHAASSDFPPPADSGRLSESERRVGPLPGSPGTLLAWENGYGRAEQIPNTLTSALSAAPYEHEFARAFERVADTRRVLSPAWMARSITIV